MVFATLAAIAVAHEAEAPPPLLVADLDTRPAYASETGSFLTAETQTFFLTTNAIAGRELWRTDGTVEGTWMVKDIESGRRSPGIIGIAVLGDRLLFHASDGDVESGLWISDGTHSGTLRITDAESFGRSVVIGGVAYFPAWLDEEGPELWRSDGTAEGTWKVHSIAPLELAAVGEHLFFSADNGAGGLELWTSDGTEAGTRIVDLGPGMSRPADLVALGDQLLFTASGSSQVHRQLSKVDATGTVVVPIIELRVPSNFYAAGNLLYFHADEPVTGREMWRSDGTAEGTLRLTDARAGPADSAYDEAQYASTGGLVYFPLAGDGLGVELWRSDGSPEGTQPVLDLLAGEEGSGPHQLLGLGDAIFFVARHGATGGALFRSDGTGSGTSSVASFGPFSLGPEELGVAGASVIFGVGDAWSGWDLWSTQGTPQSTEPLADLETANAGCHPGPFSFADGVAYFYVRGEEWGWDLDPWRTDGSTAGTRPFGEPPWDWRDGFPLIVPIGGALFYFAENGEELWKLAADASNPILLAGLGQQVNIDYPPIYYELDGSLTEPSAVAWNGELWFFAGALWRSDGTPGGTAIVRDESEFGNPKDPTVAGERLFFVDDDGIWATNGTDEAVLVKQLASGAEPFYLAAAGERLFFTASDEQRRQLWTSDGTEAGTLQLHLAAGGPSRGPVALPGGVVFDVSNDPDQREIWWSDGTEAGTRRLAEASTKPVFRIWELVGVGGTAFFAGIDEQHGRELWKTDGTEEGTGVVRDIVPGPRGSHVRELAVWGSKLVFRACDDEAGCEPWISDGTAEGTQRLADLVPGPLGSDPGRFASDGTRLVFAATSETAGREVWWVPEPASGATSAVAIGALAAAAWRRRRTLRQ